MRRRPGHELPLLPKLRQLREVDGGGQLAKNIKILGCIESLTTFFKKMGQTRPLFVSFRSFHLTNISQILTINDKSVDGVLGTKPAAAGWNALTNPLSYVDFFIASCECHSSKERRRNYIEIAM